MFSTGKLLSLLPLGVVMVQGRRQHGIREEPTAGKQRDTEAALLTSILLGVTKIG